MSIEPQCLYCNTHDKFRCKSQIEADNCGTYKRQQTLKRNFRSGGPPKIKNLNVAEIDAAIETLNKVKKFMEDQND